MTNDQETTEPEVLEWDKVAEEPEECYDWFINYYIPLGFRRTIRRAFAAWLIKNHPEGAARLANIAAQSRWTRAAEDWEWFRRAVAYDESEGLSALQAVKQAQLNLKLATVAAADALVANLGNPRLAVSAAKEILDRGGIPGRTINDNITTVRISADDMAKASKEVDEWEKQMSDSSGSSVSNP